MSAQQPNYRQRKPLRYIERGGWEENCENSSFSNYRLRTRIADRIHRNQTPTTKDILSAMSSSSTGNEHAPSLVVDFRSDTVTRPSAAMRKIIAEAEVGDNVFGDCPTVERLEAMAAEITGKEAALYVPSG